MWKNPKSLLMDYLGSDVKEAQNSTAVNILFSSQWDIYGENQVLKSRIVSEYKSIHGMGSKFIAYTRGEHALDNKLYTYHLKKNSCSKMA